MGAVGCVSPLAEVAEPCTSVGLTVDDGYELMHYERELDADHQVRFERRWVHGASTESRTEYLYTRGRLVHRLEDTDGDDRVEAVTDWTYDELGRLLRVEEYDRIGRRSTSIDQVFDGSTVVRRTERHENVVVQEERMTLDAEGRVVQHETVGTDGVRWAWWRADYEGEGFTAARHRVGYVEGVLHVDAVERFDEDGVLVYQDGLVDGFRQTTIAGWLDATTFHQRRSYGDLVELHTRSYDDAGRLLEQTDELRGNGESIDEVVTTWSYSCPP